MVLAFPLSSLKKISLLPHPLGDDENSIGYQGGKVLTAMSGRYTDPVAVFDFASLYPSCMEQHNMCPSSRLTRASAALLGVAVTTPPAASLEGTWTRADGSRASITDDWRTGAISLDGAQFRYETDINEAIVEAGGGLRAELFDGGYGLRWADGSEWARVPEEVLCFTERSVFTGIVPQLEADLKVERKAAKKRMAAAEEAGDVAGRAFMDNIQSSVKILMNGASRNLTNVGRAPP